MQIEQAPTEKPYEKPEGERRGLVLVNTGDGKGKSTAAFGLALRAHGRGKSVKIFQFMKVPTARFGEHRMFEQLGMPIEGLGDGFSWKSQDHERSAQIAREGWERARTAILSGDHFLVVLDEITYPLIYAGCRWSLCCRPWPTARAMCTSCSRAAAAPRKSLPWPIRSRAWNWSSTPSRPAFPPSVVLRTDAARRPGLRRTMAA